MNRYLSVSSLVAAALLGALRGRAVAAQQQTELDPKRAQVTRAALEDLLKRLDATAASPGSRGAIRDQARLEAASIRTRLVDGDFVAGDRIYIRVEGEQALTDTFTVGPGRVLTLPIAGEVSLKGVMRSELESHLQKALGRYIKDPVIQGRSLIRIAVLGEVTRPGFYTVPAQTLVSDALMLAGGPTREAKLDNLRIARGAQRVWEGEALERAVADGKTLDQLNLQAGDRIEVPSKSSWFTESTLRAVTLLLTIPVAIYTITRLSH
jgi:hypothetical protein